MAICNSVGIRSSAAFALIYLCFGTSAAADERQNDLDFRVLNWSRISTELLDSSPVKRVDHGVLQHQYEKRGFVAVPLDYSMPAGRQIEIFYRLLPSDGSTVAESGRPILMIMNGGPGMPSSGYRAIDHDYEAGNAVDAFNELAKHFRILMVDQRGTGNSAPLDLDDPALLPEVIARFFDSDEHARDHAKVVDAAIPESEEFFILARSYGGEIGFQYLTLGSDVRQPAGIIFSSAVLPHTDALETFLMRRQKQWELNLELRTAIPEVVAKLSRLRSHLDSLGIDPETVNFLWSNLGSGVAWEAELERKIDSLIAIDDRAAIEAEFGRGMQASVNLLNYVLSSSSLTAGYTDRSMTAETSRQIPFDPWMLDENWTLNQIGNDGTWRERFVVSVDRNPPPPTIFPRIEDIRRALLKNQALFTFGASDAFLPQDLQFNRAKKFDVPGHTEFRILVGGHGAAFSEEGVSVVVDWANRILSGPAASSEENVIITGKVTDRNGDPITKCEVFFNRETWITDESIRAECDASGTYRIAVPKGHYNSVYICDEDKYGKTALEFWGWNLDFEEDRVLDAAFDKLEVYSLAAWNSNGGPNTVFVSFRPMSVEKLQNPAFYPIEKLGPDATVLDITPSLDMSGVTAEIDGAPVTVKSLQWIYEKQNKCSGGQSGSCYMPVAIAQLDRPVLTEGAHLLRIRVTDHETGAIGEAVTEFSSNRAGYGF